MIRYKITTPSLKQIEDELGIMKDKSKMVLRNAINTTAKQTENLLVAEARKQYIIQKPARIKRTMLIKKATIRKLTATIRSSGRVSELYDFSVRPREYNPLQRPPKGHKGHAKRANRAGNLYYKPGSDDEYKAFTVKYSSGHISVAQRIPGSKRIRPSGKRKLAAPRRGHPREEESIKNIYSLSIPTMLGYEKGVWGVVNPEIEEKLLENIWLQMHRYLDYKGVGQ